MPVTYKSIDFFLSFLFPIFIQFVLKLHNLFQHLKINLKSFAMCPFPRDNQTPVHGFRRDVATEIGMITVENWPHRYYGYGYYGAY